MPSRFTPHELIWTRENSARFWDFFGTREGLHETYFSFQVGDDVLEFTSKYIALVDQVLDYGSGPGFFVEKLLSRGIRCKGLDISADSVDLLNRMFSSNPNFEGAVHADTLPSQIPADSCKTVFLLETIEHLLHDDLPETLEEIHRVTRIGGHVVITTPNEEDLEAEKTICPECGSIFHTIQHVSAWSVASLISTMTTFGFETIACTAKNFRPRSRWNGIKEFALRLRKQKPNNLVYIGRKK